MSGTRRAWYVCKRTGTVTLGASYYTHVTTLCGRKVEPEKASESDDRVTCTDCLKILCEELKRKTERICSKLEKGES